VPPPPTVKEFRSLISGTTKSQQSIGRSEEINHATVVCAAHRHPDTYSRACDRDGVASMIDVFDRAISVF
jgi:hypothetical protein